MPSFETARRIASVKNNGAKTIGKIHKENSAFVMEATWDEDIASEVCYIYDYYHDDQKHLCHGMTYENTTKTKIDAKILVSKYGSVSKDQPELHCMFKPSQKVVFDETDELYYMEEYRRKYGLDDIFVGMYIDIPDKDNIYHKHLICLKDIEQDFQKYYILPCNYNFQFIRHNNGKRFKQEIWCVLKSQSSYNSGLWTDRYITSVENQEIIFLPTNYITDTINYISSNNKTNQRVIIDIPNYGNDLWYPNTWVVSKIERANVRGRTKVTLAQEEFDPHLDYIERDESGKIIGLWADYYISVDPIPTEPETPTLPSPTIRSEIIASNSDIKVGGSYKTLTLKLYDSDNIEITSNYTDKTFVWSCSIDGEEITDAVKWLNTGGFNQIKIKFLDDRSYLDKILEVKCTVTDEIDIITTEKFKLISS